MGLALVFVYLGRHMVYALFNLLALAEPHQLVALGVSYLVNEGNSEVAVVREYLSHLNIETQLLTRLA
jgi:hypothetical protein